MTNFIRSQPKQNRRAGRVWEILSARGNSPQFQATCAAAWQYVDVHALLGACFWNFTVPVTLANACGRYGHPRCSPRAPVCRAGDQIFPASNVLAPKRLTARRLEWESSPLASTAACFFYVHVVQSCEIWFATNRSISSRLCRVILILRCTSADVSSAAGSCLRRRNFTMVTLAPCHGSPRSPGPAALDQGLPRSRWRPRLPAGPRRTRRWRQLGLELFDA